MMTIHYPEPSFRIKKQGENDFLFDNIRKRWLLLTPEEWVRQNFIQYLARVKGYPFTLIAQEKTIRLGELKKRFDILVYDGTHKPFLMVECKAPQIPLTQEVLNQVLRYNITVPVIYIIITNGNETIGWRKTSAGLELIKEMPEFNPAF